MWCSGSFSMKVVSTVAWHDFVYLAVVLDKFSRRVVGWNLARMVTARLPLGALEMA